MAIRRTPLPFEGQFTQIPNAWLRDPNLSRRARGLLAEILSHQHGWVISVHSLWRNGPEGREAIRKAILELADAGYLVRDQTHGERGRFGEMNYVLAAPELSTVTVAQKLGDGTETGARSTVAQESTHKNTIGKNTNLRGPDDGLTPTPELVPWCPNHPANNATRPCAACKRARLIWEQTLVAGSRSDVWQPTPTHSKAWRPGLCVMHLQDIETCGACAEDRRRGVIA